MATDSLQGITVFVRVAETRSFTAAARKLGMSTSGASKAIARLEERLGVRLVQRKTARQSSFQILPSVFLYAV